ncbi:acyl-CoA--sterol O-acyltransferase 1 [Ricinus communis]|uniref:acyl-CoA--sterol O-acyltransferase 1 n=1 Tax=Ricinus communis TaxID=3988 RepID=UPI0007728DCF|nr:acyl-CoA--sterol O-acyltransferase 1 [Ricinus communis]|eukprot:XP_015580109.1 acyl-CoA--sterol O-acyltransferase 1 [Ricinus communis]
MEGEISKFLKVWLLVFASLIYCYALGKNVPEGKSRFILLLPIICLFLYLPLNLSTIHLGGMTAFFIAWLANFKLLLFAFGKGPLSSNPSISLPSFLALSCLPIKIQDNPSPKSQLEQNPYPKISKQAKKSSLNYAIKGILLATLVHVYNYNDYIHPKIVLCFYCVHIYFFLEIVLAMVTAVVRTILRVELEPPFNDPYLSTSLQDFWGKRWNLMVSSILRSTIYEPTLTISARIIGRKWAPIPGVLASFLVSAVMHELMFYYLGRVRPTWEVTWFFILHGFCVVVEIAIKKALKGRWRLPELISGVLAVGFVVVTGFWLFFPQFLQQCRADVRAFEEYAALGPFLKNSYRVIFRPVVTSFR